MSKVGVLGGTFDPVHNAHLMIAEQAYRQFGLDKVLFMPSANPPHKNSKEILSISKRIKMIRLAIADYSYIQFSDFELKENSDFELKEKGNVYTADTLERYKKMNPQDELFFIIGSDSLYSIDTWYHPEKIFEFATILAAKRLDKSSEFLKDKIDFLKNQYNANVFELTVEANSISSTEIRNTKNRNDLYNLMPKAVADYIIENSIYVENAGSKRYTITEIIEDLKKEQSEHRFNHTLNVAKTAKHMAEALGENPNKAYLAGILHDCAKSVSDEELIQICKDNNIFISESEQVNSFLLHAKVGGYFAKEKYNITDEDVLSAIKYHTTGNPNMTLLEKIIFVADYIEPGRNQAPNLELLRTLAYKNIDETVYLILKDTLEYLKKSGCRNIDKNTNKSFQYYKNLLNK